MASKALVKALITVQTVRNANEKMMRLPYAALSPASTSLRLRQQTGSVERAAQLAMQATKR